MQRSGGYWVVVACLFCSTALAQQTFPNKLIRVVNPAAPGGNSDVFFRLLQPKMTEALGQQLVFDYRAGGGGTIGGEIIAKSAPDGYTVGLVAGHLQLQFSSLPLVSGHLQQGRIKLIAQTGDKRAGFAKDIPTMIEAGGQHVG